MTSVIPYMAQVAATDWAATDWAATDWALNWAAIIDRPIITHFSMTDISIFIWIRA